MPASPQDLSNPTDIDDTTIDTVTPTTDLEANLKLAAQVRRDRAIQALHARDLRSQAITTAASHVADREALLTRAETFLKNLQAAGKTTANMDKWLNDLADARTRWSQETML